MQQELIVESVYNQKVLILQRDQFIIYANYIPILIFEDIVKNRFYLLWPSWLFFLFWNMNKHTKDVPAYQIIFYVYCWCMTNIQVFYACKMQKCIWLLFDAIQVEMLQSYFYYVYIICKYFDFNMWLKYVASFAFGLGIWNIASINLLLRSHRTPTPVSHFSQYSNAHKEITTLHLFQGYKFVFFRFTDPCRKSSGSEKWITIWW